jgi:hypothetical protein
VLCERREGEEGVLCQRAKRGGGGGCVFERDEKGVFCVSEFWKMVYEKFGRKLFSIFLN